MHARMRAMLAALLAAAVLLAALPAPVALAAGGKQPASQEELEKLERQLRKEGKVTRRIEAPKGTDPQLLARRNYCGEAWGSCWSTVGCLLGYCLCMAEKSCLERQGQH